MNMKENGEVQQSKDAEANTEDNPMRLLEDALVICKFGWFHIKLLITSLASVFATTAVTASTSYILPSAECDLGLTMMQKGVLNAIPFVGQVGASLFTGFMTDAFGRKIFLVGGNLCLFACAVIGASSQTFWMLTLAKLLEGIVMSLIFTATATMITEFTNKNARDRVLLLYSAFMSISIITSALLGWALLPRPYHFVVVEGYFEIHSWNIYLYACSAWSLLAAIMYYQIPESPKFLLSHGQENEALEVLKEIYRTNTGKDVETFSVTSLNVSGVYKPTIEISIKKQLVNGLFEMKEIFRRPLIFRLILFSTITFVCLLAYSALRLWFPQLSTIIENYQIEHGGEDLQFCTILNEHKKRNINASLVISDLDSEICEPQLSGSETYTNGIIMGFASLLCIGVSSYLVDYMGQKPLIFVFLILCSACSSSLYWTNSSLQIAILISATCGFMQAAFSLQHSIVCRVFPTTVRTTALSLCIMIGRIGSVLGNVLFPLLLEMGCMAPFIMLTSITLCVAGLVYFLPNPRKENSGTGDK